MIYTASYFRSEHHHGKLISISSSKPKEFARLPKLDFFTPSKDLLNWWKKSAQTKSDWQNYQDRFFDEMDVNTEAIANWLNQAHRYDVTLLCWEKPGEWGHRNCVGELIANRLPRLWGGFDQPLTRVEQMVMDCQNKGLKVKCERLNFDDFSLYHAKLGKKDLGQWTETGMQNILSQLLNPTNPVKWFKEFGLDIDLEVIGHPSLKLKDEPKRSLSVPHDKRESTLPVSTD